MIRRRGENVAPAEIEEALASHPDVVEVAVVGVPSELSEEDIKAFVVMRDGAEPDFDALREWASRPAHRVQGAEPVRGARRAAPHRHGAGRET